MRVMRLINGKPRTIKKRDPLTGLDTVRSKTLNPGELYKENN
jgi:hypothetical protein